MDPKSDAPHPSASCIRLSTPTRGPDGGQPRAAERSRTGLHRWIRPAWQWRLWLAGLVGARYDGLRHFAVVEPGVLMRCGQPRVSDLEQIRRRYGLKSLVVARGGTRHPLRGRWFAREQAYCSREGIRLEHLPFSDDSLPPGDVFERFLDVVRHPENRPVLVHCEQGFHRTGILIAAYRIAISGWPIERALDEMRRAGFDPADRKRAALHAALLDWAGRRHA